MFMAAAGVLIAAFVSGCCGGAPTHGCMFNQTSKDASSDMSMDGPQMCSQFESCSPDETCCIQTDPVISVMCIPKGAVCKGTLGMCAGDGDCQDGLHCCGTIDLNTAQATIQCQADCPGTLQSPDNTARLCKSASECPSNLPYCGQIFINGMGLYVCLPPRGA
jgi:hypothetical protein